MLTVGTPPSEVKKTSNKLTKRWEEDEKECLAILLIHPEYVGEGGGSERRYIPQLHNSTEVMSAAVFPDRGLIVYLNGAGWLREMVVSSGERKQPMTGQILVETGVAESQGWDSRGKIVDVGKNSLDHSIQVADLRLDHISKGIDIFPNVKHRQRHGTREPYRRLRKV